MIASFHMPRTGQVSRPPPSSVLALLSLTHALPNRRSERAATELCLQAREERKGHYRRFNSTCREVWGKQELRFRLIECMPASAIGFAIEEHVLTHL
jgi:hypothetical protein